MIISPVTPSHQQCCISCASGGSSPVTQMHKAISIGHFILVSDLALPSHRKHSDSLIALISPGLASNECQHWHFRRAALYTHFALEKITALGADKYTFELCFLPFFPSERNQCSVPEYCLVILLQTNGSPPPSNDRTFALRVIQHPEWGNWNRRAIYQMNTSFKKSFPFSQKCNLWNFSRRKRDGKINPPVKVQICN